MEMWKNATLLADTGRRRARHRERAEREAPQLRDVFLDFLGPQAVFSSSIVSAKPDDDEEEDVGVDDRVSVRDSRDTMVSFVMVSNTGINSGDEDCRWVLYRLWSFRSLLFRLERSQFLTEDILKVW